MEQETVMKKKHFLLYVNKFCYIELSFFVIYRNWIFPQPPKSPAD
jgi:hypothetical protein